MFYGPKSERVINVLASCFWSLPFSKDSLPSEGVILGDSVTLWDLWCMGSKLWKLASLRRGPRAWAVTDYDYISWWGEKNTQNSIDRLAHGWWSGNSSTVAFLFVWVWASPIEPPSRTVKWVSRGGRGCEAQAQGMRWLTGFGIKGKFEWQVNNG